jgi:hypothetical protein
MAMISCSLCGRSPEPDELAGDVPVTWMHEVDARRGPQWVCTRCARTHLRAIEGKLDQAWW